MKGITAVLFDAGGTLIHVDGPRICRTAGVAYSESVFREAEAGAHDEARQWITRYPSSTDAERFPIFMNGMLQRLGLEDSQERQAATDRLGREHERNNLWSRPGHGAQSTLEALRARGYRLGVVSNSNGHVRRLLETAGLARLLEVIIDSSDLGIEKPDPRIFHAATQQLNVEPSACAYVGDIYEIDAIGAKAAGLVPVLLGSSPAPEPILRVAALPDLLNFLPPPESAPSSP